MLVLQIIKVNKYNPIKWDPNNSNPNELQSIVHVTGNQPNNPEYGSLNVSVKLIYGNFEAIENLVFIKDDIQNGKLLNYKKGASDNYNIEITFNCIYFNGLEYSLEEVIQANNLIIGYSSDEAISFSTYEKQYELLTLLTKYLVPSKFNEILGFVKQCYVCIPNEDTNENQSHFLGKPKHELIDLEIPDNSQPLFPIATIFTDDLKIIKNNQFIKKYLSFYLRINETEYGWPENKKDFKVLNYNKLQAIQNDSNQHFDVANNFSLFELLDIPNFDHSLIHISNFTEDERDNYALLKEAYLNIIGKDIFEEELNKIFGYPDSIQNCVSYEAELNFNNREHSEEIYVDAINWMLLLQVSPYCKSFSFFDDFGDGSIYYMIRKQDFENGNFDNCQVIVQST